MPRSQVRATPSMRIGDVNRHGQTVVKIMGLLRPNPEQRAYVLHCGECGAEYGATGADIRERRCPCQGGPRLTRV